ncbi:MAG: PspA/IM30 family protein [Pseudomonadota bacterium]
MAIIHRISQLFRADVHAVLDRIEEPEVLLKQAIRDMEDELVAAEQSLALSTHERDLLEARKREVEVTIGEIQQQLDICFASNKTDLARGQIRKRLECERLLKRITEKLTSVEASLSEQQAKLKENRTTLESLRQKTELFAHSATVGRKDGIDALNWSSTELAISDDEVEIELLREQNMRRAT